MSKRICANEDCEMEYDTRNKKYGKINVCNKCGKEQEEGMKRDFDIPVRRKRVLN